MIDTNLYPVSRCQKWGLIDSKGTLVFDEIFSQIGSFRAGYCTVVESIDGNLLYRLIDSNGRTIFTTSDYLSHFSEDRILAQQSQTNKIGFKDVAGNYVIPPIYDAVDREGTYYVNPNGFSEGKTFVIYQSKWTCIDQSGNVLFQNSQWKEVGRYCNGLAVVEDQNQQSFFMTADGCQIDLVPKEYRLERLYRDNFYGFRNGFCRVRNKFGTTFIDTTGELIFPEKHFEFATDFHEGLSVVRSEGKYGAIDRNGDFVIPPRFDSIGNFNFGLAPYRSLQLFGLIDCTGKIILEARWDAEINLSNILPFGKIGPGDPFHTTSYSSITRATLKKRNGQFQKPQEVYIDRQGQVLFEFER